MDIPTVVSTAKRTAAAAYLHITLWNVCVCVCAGVVSCENQYPPTSGTQDDYVSSGPMCRYAEDLLPMLKIMAGPNARM